MRKLSYIFVLSMCIMLACGCGKKEETSIADNLINDNPTEITGDYADMVSEWQEKKESESVFAGIDGGDESVNNASDNGAIETDASDNAIDNSKEESVFDENVIVKDVPAEKIDNTTEEKTDSQEVKIELLNLSGCNLDKIFITINEFGINNAEVLAFDDLKDGRAYTYSVGEFNNLNTFDKITVKISAVTMKNENIDFGEIEISEYNSILIDLVQREKGYLLIEE